MTVFGKRLVVGIANTAHGCGHAIFRQAIRVSNGQILRPVGAVMDQSPFRLSLRARPGPLDQTPTLYASSDSLANRRSAERKRRWRKQHTQTGPRGNEGEIGYPQLIRT